VGVQTSLIRKPFRQPSYLQAKKTTAPKIVIKPEFSRILDIAQIAPSREVLCRLLAKPAERDGLAKRFGIDALSYFAANVTVFRDSMTTVSVSGTFEAHIPLPLGLEPDVVRGDFDTKLLWSGGGGAAARAMMMAGEVPWWAS
jgi:hypothetical protein